MHVRSRPRSLSLFSLDASTPDVGAKEPNGDSSDRQAPALQPAILVCVRPDFGVDSDGFTLDGVARSIPSTNLSAALFPRRSRVSLLLRARVPLSLSRAVAFARA